MTSNTEDQLEQTDNGMKMNQVKVGVPRDLRLFGG